MGACKFVLGQSDEKEKNLERLVVYLEDHDTITNDDVEALLDVSHATATRYLDELEDEDLIEQIGITGRAVHYKVK
ncbi:MAG: DeoR family transcriptional regulator [Waddliaceae bacterium]